VFPVFYILHILHSESYEIVGWIELDRIGVPGEAKMGSKWTLPVDYTLHSWEVEWRLLQDSPGEPLGDGYRRERTNIYSSKSPFFRFGSYKIDTESYATSSIEFSESRVVPPSRVFQTPAYWQKFFYLRIPPEAYSPHWHGVSRYLDISARVWFKSDLFSGKHVPLAASRPSNVQHLFSKPYEQIFRIDDRGKHPSPLPVDAFLSRRRIL
jgi:hypothetical protein